MLLLAHNFFIAFLDELQTNRQDLEDFRASSGGIPPAGSKVKNINCDFVSKMNKGQIRKTIRRKRSDFV